MKKIILVFDGTNFSESSFKFVNQLNNLSPVMVTGVFMPLVNYANLWSYATSSGEHPALIPLVEEFEVEVVEQHINQFKSLCQANNIHYKVHKDFSDFVLPELKKESRFADLIILNAESFFNEVSDSRFEYINEAIHEAECPVLVLPDQGLFPDTNILAYDGSRESVYAMKQFYYLFPELAKNKTLLVYAGARDKEIPSEDRLVELATQHFSELTYAKLEGNSKQIFTDWLEDKTNSLLISGSLGRSPLSQFFRKSFVAEIIKEHRLPVFIAHL